MYPSFFKNDARPFLALISFTLNAFIGCWFLIQADVFQNSGVVVVSDQDSYGRIVYKIQYNDFQLPGLLLRSAIVSLGLDHKIKTGEYQFERGDPVWSLFYRMILGRVKQHSFRIIEGEDVFDIAQALRNNTHLAQGDVNLMEGSLLPDTYFFVKGDQPSDLLARAKKAQVEYLADIWKDRDVGLPWQTLEEAIIVASMLEKESKLIDERQKIAQVILNRLQKNMRLQIDATAIYGLKNIQHVAYKHIKMKNELNTYQISGLPLHPICMPSRESLYAALHPRGENDILYYVLMPDGRHHFSRTLQEHGRMKEKMKNDSG